MITCKMKSLLVLAAMVVVMPVWAGASTNENKVDLGKLTCKELMRGNDSDREIGIAFYQGFLAGKKNEQIIDIQAASSLTDRVKDYCLSNPNTAVVEAFTKSAK